MQQPGGAAAREGHRPQEATGLALLWFYATLSWCSLLGLIAHASSTRIPWRDLAVFSIAGVLGAHTIRTRGLLALATRAHGDSRPAWASAAWRWFAHFKLSGAVFAVSGVASWFAFPWLLMWLVEPFARPWGVPATALPLHFSSVHELLKTKLVLAVAFAGLAAVPVLASDVWRLLTPLMNARAARLRLAFALATSLVIVAAVLLIRYCARDAWTIWLALGPQNAEL